MAGVAGAAVAGQLLGRRKKLRGCIYARFSTRFQHSIDDQLRACREWADKNNVTVLDRHVFSDAGETGKKSRRPGHQAMLAALAAGEIDVVITFSTNRLHHGPVQRDQHRHDRNRPADDQRPKPLGLQRGD
ncbi:MAG TPA: recombinase family protein [Roseimicrobium sp.]|nr:recombinase family protein [Roseimicrobium sp.]